MRIIFVLVETHQRHVWQLPYRLRNTDSPAQRRSLDRLHPGDSWRQEEPRPTDGAFIRTDHLLSQRASECGVVLPDSSQSVAVRERCR